MYNTKEYKVTKTGGASSRTYILEYIGNQSIVIGSARLTITLATKECEIKNIQISKEYRGLGYSYQILEAVKDYIAGMTDRFALHTYTDLFVPKGWK